MRGIFATIAVAVLTLGPVAKGQTQAPAAFSATCKDGSTWSGAHRSGACRGHHGVAVFGPAPIASPAPTPEPVAAAPSPLASAAPRPPSDGGGVGQVWVNTSSKIYHCPGDRDYGHTKQGSYMTEAGAKAAGARPSRGKACS